MLCIERNCPAGIGDIVVALDDKGENTLKRYKGFDKEKGCYVLAYENKAKHSGKVINVKAFTVQGVARQVLKAL